jgi:hypothetical protein
LLAEPGLDVDRAACASNGRAGQRDLLSGVEHYTDLSANHATIAWHPVLNLSFAPVDAEDPDRRFYRMRFIDPGTP